MACHSDIMFINEKFDSVMALDTDQRLPDRGSPHISTRLVICVDGTWTEPDGVCNDERGNLSNIYRTYLSVQEGETTDHNGRKWIQKRKYFHGLKGVDGFIQGISKYAAGIFGSGLHDEIKDVYKYCCEHAPSPDDEIYFFGFSRGAFTVRAVANILYYCQVPRTLESPEFDSHYGEALKLYLSLRNIGTPKPGAVSHLMTGTKLPPDVRFVGVFDTVKAFKDDGLYDILPVSTADSFQFRQALALNERRTRFLPEVLTLPPDAKGVEPLPDRSRRLLQAWFLGTHSDLGGANKHDGLSLYPLQWMLSEAHDTGLRLGFVPPMLKGGRELSVDNPLHLAFPGSGPSANLPQASDVLTTRNGITVKLWNIEDAHQSDERFRVKMNTSANSLLFSNGPRPIFDADGGLLGYDEHNAFGTFIHPSAYLVYDVDFHIQNIAQGWDFKQSFLAFRNKCIPQEEDVSWDHSETLMDANLKQVRVLICGNAGIGKSTLLNKLTGMDAFTETSESDHVQHDITVGKITPNKKMIVHDSRGFAAGKTDELELMAEFLRQRSKEHDIAERLHAIWYCVAADRTRNDDVQKDGVDAGSGLFSCLASCDSNIPVIIICTRYDVIKAMYRQEATQEVLESKGLDPDDDGDQLEQEDRARIKCIEEEKIKQRKNKLTEDLRAAAGTVNFIGPIFTSANRRGRESDASIVEVSRETRKALTNDTVRRIYMAAQVCDIEDNTAASIENAIRLYGHAIRTSAIPIAFTGAIAATTVTSLICTETLNIFGCPTANLDIFTRMISNAFLSNSAANLVQGLAQSLAAAGVFLSGTGVGAMAGFGGAALVSTVAVPQYGRLLLLCTVDVILIMQCAFWHKGGNSNITSEMVDQACEWYRGIASNVHADVRTFLPLYGYRQAFRCQVLKQGVTAIVKKYRFHGNIQ